MQVNWWILLVALSATIASFAQIILKKSAMEEHKNFIGEYLNVKVIVGYGLMFVGMFLNIYAYSKNVTLQNSAMMQTIGNIWVVILSWKFFSEPITKKKVLGNILIIGGIIAFNL
ncbi:MAG: multidrug ABC transporter [Lachnospiraceae bacterium]|jgi:small multidrug resistance pump|nr:multidrug ABC transporter [Lachnospiraceae bacterium]MCI1726362.1 multidrug ABC transporter [Lachnospiraceae bacterium]